MASDCSGLSVAHVLTSRCGISGCLSEVRVTVRVRVCVQNQREYIYPLSGLCGHFHFAK